MRYGVFLTVIIIDGGDVFAWGLNQHGQCGVGTLTDELKSGGHAECFKVSTSNVFQPLSIKRLPAVSEVFQKCFRSVLWLEPCACLVSAPDYFGKFGKF